MVLNVEKLMSWFGDVPKGNLEQLKEERNPLQQQIDSQNPSYGTLEFELYSTIQELAELNRTNKMISNDLTIRDGLYSKLKDEYYVLKNQHSNCESTISVLEEEVNKLQGIVVARDPVKVHAKLIKEKNEYLSKSYEKAAESARVCAGVIVANSNNYFRYLDHNFDFLRTFANSLNLNESINMIEISTNNDAGNFKKTLRDKIQTSHIDFLSDLNDGGFFGYWVDIKDNFNFNIDNLELNDYSLVLLNQFNNDGKIVYKGHKLDIDSDDNNDSTLHARELLKELSLIYMVGVVQAELSKESDIKYSQIKNISELVIREGDNIDKDFRPLISEAYNKAKPDLVSLYIPKNL
jgi:hypothetical protein